MVHKFNGLSFNPPPYYKKKKGGDIAGRVMPALQPMGLLLDPKESLEAIALKFILENSSFELKLENMGVGCIRIRLRIGIG